MACQNLPDPAYTLLRPAALAVPMIVASPHSGAIYPPDLIAASRLSLEDLRRSEDCFVDELFAAAPFLGVPLLKALFPRAYVDANREPFELDATMFEDELPGYVNRSSPRVAVGLGTIARVVADSEPIYARRLNFPEVQSRIERCYRPYHKELEALVSESVGEFGTALLLDAHSMPSSGVRHDRRVDIVLGDRLGSSCHPSVTRLAEKTLRERGYAVALNTPYAGGFTTKWYGRPALGRHCLQVEINRALYMDERRFERHGAFEAVQRDLASLVEELARLAVDLIENEPMAAQ